MFLCTLCWLADSKSFIISLFLYIFSLYIYGHITFETVNKIYYRNTAYIMVIKGTKQVMTDSFSIFATKKKILNAIKTNINKMKENESSFGKIKRVQYPLMCHLDEESQKEVIKLTNQLLSN